MKRFTAIVLVLILTLMPITAGGVSAADLPFNVSAESAVLYCAENGEFLYEKNADAVLPMASLTKVMTAIVTIETVSLDKEITIPPQACGIEGSSIYLTPGEKLTIRDLLYALMLESANDAAAALAIAVAGSVEEFTVLMNQKAQELSLSASHFTNPHGLDHEDHRSSARDLALLLDHALKNSVFSEIASTRKTEIPYGENKTGRLLINHNRLLSSYEGCIGGKTGYTRRCGRCLVSAARREDITLICVTLNAPDDWDDHRALFDLGFSSLKRYSLVEENTYISAHVISGVTDTVKARVEPLSAVLTESQYNSLRPVYNLKRFYFAPISRDTKLGNVLWYAGEKLVGESPVQAVGSIDAIRYKRSILERFLDLFRK